jgi:hypothetical protein
MCCLLIGEHIETSSVEWDDMVDYEGSGVLTFGDGVVDGLTTDVACGLGGTDPVAVPIALDCVAWALGHGHSPWQSGLV